MKHRFFGKLRTNVCNKRVESQLKEFYFFSKEKNVNGAANDVIEEKVLEAIFGEAKAVFISNPTMDETKCEANILFKNRDELIYITFEIEYKDSWKEAA